MQTGGRRATRGTLRDCVRGHGPGVRHAGENGPWFPYRSDRRPRRGTLHRVRMAGRWRKLCLRRPGPSCCVRVDEESASPELRHRPVAHHHSCRPSRPDPLIPSSRQRTTRLQGETMSTQTADNSSPPETSLGAFSTPGATATPWEETEWALRRIQKFQAVHGASGWPSPRDTVAIWTLDVVHHRRQRTEGQEPRGKSALRARPPEPTRSPAPTTSSKVSHASSPRRPLGKPSGSRSKKRTGGSSPAKTQRGTD